MTYNATAAQRRKLTPGGHHSDQAGGAIATHLDSTPSAPTSQPAPNAPSGRLPVTIDADGCIWVAGRHLCRVRHGELLRTFDARRELLRGGLAFRVDLLRLAVEAGARWIVATERGTGDRWIIHLDAFRERGWGYTHPDFGAQWCADLRFWRCDPAQPEAQPAQPRQLELFGEVARR